MLGAAWCDPSRDDSKGVCLPPKAVCQASLRAPAVAPENISMLQSSTLFYRLFASSLLIGLTNIIQYKTERVVVNDRIRMAGRSFSCPASSASFSASVALECRELRAHAGGRAPERDALHFSSCQWLSWDLLSPLDGRFKGPMRLIKSKHCIIMYYNHNEHIINNSIFTNFLFENFDKLVL